MYYCEKVTVRAPGKVNLSLDIVGDDDAGYHLLETVMLAMDLCDTLTLHRRTGTGITVSCSRADIPADDSNLAVKAAKAFFGACGMPERSVDIHIQKKIPVQAGLAGGSADAAGVLVGLNRLFETRLTGEALCEIGLQVGADVPFCIQGGCRLAKGRGEVLSHNLAMPVCYIAIAKPPRGISTRLAFQLYDQMSGAVPRPDTGSMLDAIEKQDLKRIGGCMRNIFEELSLVQEVEVLKGIMLCDGAMGSVMSGSGSAVIGLFASQREARISLRHLLQQVDEAWLVNPLPCGAEILEAL